MMKPSRSAYATSATHDHRSHRAKAPRPWLPRAALTALAFSLAGGAWSAEQPKPAEAATKDADAALLKELRP